MVKPHIADVVEALASAQQATDETIGNIVADLDDFAGCIDEHADALEDIIDAIDEHADGYSNHAECLEAIYDELDWLKALVENDNKADVFASVRIDGVLRELDDHKVCIEKLIGENAKLADRVAYLDSESLRQYCVLERLDRASHYVPTFLSRLRWLFTGR